MYQYVHFSFQYDEKINLKKISLFFGINLRTTNCILALILFVSLSFAHVLY